MNIPSSVTIQPGAFVDEGVILEENVKIFANAAVLATDELTGRLASTTIHSEAIIGANATISPGVTIGYKALVKPGSVVTRTVPPLAIVEGNPAIITGYLSTHAETVPVRVVHDRPEKMHVINSKVEGVTYHVFRLISDLRGNLTVGEFAREVPFEPKRYFIVLDVPSAETRGEHAHRECQQFLICLKGSCSVVADNGQDREEFILDAPNKGLYLPPMIWGIQYKYSSDAVLLVFASHHYDPIDYIRDYGDFLQLASAKAYSS